MEEDGWFRPLPQRARISLIAARRRGPRNRRREAADLRAIDVMVQGSWLRRPGLRGRCSTIYVHPYCGRESTERLHSHPWSVASGGAPQRGLSVVLGAEGRASRRRGLLSLAMYKRETRHRIKNGDAVTEFVGVLRTQTPIERVAEFRTAEGSCNYMEIMPDEPGFRSTFLAPGEVRPIGEDNHER